MSEERRKLSSREKRIAVAFAAAWAAGTFGFDLLAEDRLAVRVGGVAEWLATFLVSGTLQLAAAAFMRIIYRRGRGAPDDRPRPPALVEEEAVGRGAAAVADDPGSPPA